MSTKISVSREQIRAARELLGGMTQEDLAAAAGVARQTLAMFEAGQTVPYPRTLDAIREALEKRGIIFGNGDRPSVTLDRSKAIIPS